MLLGANHGRQYSTRQISFIIQIAKMGQRIPEVHQSSKIGGIEFRDYVSFDTAPKRFGERNPFRKVIDQQSRVEKRRQQMLS
jgi:hypothetical protein